MRIVLQTQLLAGEFFFFDNDVVKCKKKNTRWKAKELIPYVQHVKTTGETGYADYTYCTCSTGFCKTDLSISIGGTW